MSPRLPARRAVVAGFTLVEVIVAIAIMGVIGTIAWSTLAGTLQVRDFLEEDDETARAARATMGRIRRQLSVAYLTDSTSAVNTYRTVFVGEDDDDTDRLWFATLGHRRTYANAREGDQAEITWWTETDPDHPDRLVLLHRESGRVDHEPAQSGGIAPLARNVTRFDLRYLDGTTSEWRDDWDTMGAETPNRLPRAVQISLSIMVPDPDEDEQIERTFVETVLLNMASPITQSLLDGGEAEEDE